MINLKTLTMQLIDADPEGIKICHLAGSTLVTVVIPRSLLSTAKTLPDIPARGVYYLLDDNKGRLRRVYVGQTVQGIGRLDGHNSKKSWWNKAVMFLAPDNEFSMDVVSGLEAMAIQYVKDHGAYEVDNGVDPKPYVSPYNESFINSLHEDILFRMAVLGFDLDAVGDGKKGADAQAVFHTAKRGVKGLGCYDAEEGVFEVLAGSQICADVLPGSKKRPNNKIIALRNQLEERAALVREDGIWVLKEKVSFTSPSTAAVFVLGGSQNGWAEWIDSQGRTLSYVYRGEASGVQD